MIVKCKYCNKEFNIRPSAYKKSKSKIFYCCKDHMNKDRNIGKTKVKCATCGKEFEKKNSQVKDLNFCCRKCIYMADFCHSGIFECHTGHCDSVGFDTGNRAESAENGQPSINVR